MKASSASWPAGLAPLVHWQPLTGGMVCQTWHGWLADGSEVLVKRSPYPAALEADGLGALARSKVPVPTVRGVMGQLLILDFVRGEPDWPGLGMAVARMHRTTGPAYGWHVDNFAGRFDQPNGWLTSWSEFYTERRVRVHLGDPNVPDELRVRLQRACDGPLPDLLPTHPTPSLTHGDLWAGNVVAGRWLVDPEVSFADRELDLAYMQISDSLPPSFWAAYERELPYEIGYEHRRPALQLHHRLLQIRHFGPDGFGAGVEAVLRYYGW